MRFVRSHAVKNDRITHAQLRLYRDGVNCQENIMTGTDADVAPNVQNVDVPNSVVEEKQVTPSREISQSEPSSSEKDKTFTQAEVARISADVKNRTAEKLRKEFEQRNFILQQSQEQPIAETPDGDKPLTYNDFVRMQQEAAKQTAKMQVEAIESDFKSRLHKIVKEDPAFVDTVLASLPGNLHPTLMAGMTSLDNMKEVLEEMEAHPSKFAELQIAARDNPRWGLSKLVELSTALRKSKEALARPVAPEPVEQLKNSPLGKDAGSMTITQMRKLPKYRM